MDLEQDRLLEIKEKQASRSKSSSSSNSSSSNASSNTSLSHASSGGPLASKIRYYRKTSALLERFFLAIEKRAAIRVHRNTFGSGVDALNVQLRAGTDSAQTGPRSREPPPAVPDAVATGGGRHMLPVLPDAIRLQAAHIRDVVPQQFLAIPTSSVTNELPSSANAADSSSSSSSTSHQQPLLKKQKPMGPYSYVGQHAAPQSQSTDTYAEDRAKYNNNTNTAAKKRKPKCCGTCGHFLSEGPYGAEAYHGKVGGGGAVTCRVSVDLRIPQNDRFSGWCACERCSLFATPELRAILFPPGSYMRRQQTNRKRKASRAGSDGDEGHVINGGDGEAEVDKEEASAAAA